MKRIFCLLFVAALTLAFGLMPRPASATVTTGTCGDNISFEFDDSTGVVTMTGFGPMTDYASAAKSPFYTNRSKISSVVIGEGITTVGAFVFSANTKLTTISLPSTIEEIHQYAFNGCTGVTSCDLPEGITKIDKYACNRWIKMTALELPTTLETIGQSAFNGWSLVTELEIPASVKAIEQSAFSGWTGLTSLTLNEGLETIGYTAFGSLQITGVTIPASVTEIGYDAFSGCNNLAAYAVAEGNANYTAVDGILCTADKKTVIDCPMGKAGAVTLDPACETIEDGAFKECWQITSVTIPDSVTTIGPDAFSYSGITSITIPASVTQLASGVFAYCDSLTSATINASIDTLPQNIFSYCPALESVVLADNITALSNGSFNGCSSLAHIDLPEGLTVIPENCFYNCTSLTGVEIPETVVEIGPSAFFSCVSITELTLPEGLKVIGMNAFAGGYNPTGCSFTTIVLPEGLTSLGNGAFSQCRSLTSIVLPASIVPIPGMLFTGCSSLEVVEVMGDLTQASGQCIMSSAFNNCTSLEQIIFHCPAPDIKNVNSYAFSGTNKSLEIHYPANYSEWAKTKPLDVGGNTFTYVADPSPIIEMVSVEFRQRPTNDGCRDVRFIAKYTPLEGCEITARYALIARSDSGNVHHLDCPETFSVGEDGSEIFTIVARNVKPQFFDVTITVTAYIECTGAYEGVLRSGELSTTVNELEAAD